MKIFRLRAYKIFLCSALCCALSSCAGRSLQPEPAVPIMQWEGKSPADVLHALQEGQNRITSLTAAFSLSVDPPPKGRPSNMQGILFVERSDPPRVRIKCLGPFGRIMFDMVSAGDDIQIYLPSKQTMYRGKADPDSQKKNVWKNVMESMFVNLAEAALPQGASLSFMKNEVVLPLISGELRLDRATGFIRQWQRADTTTTYDSYEAQAGLPPLPGRIRLRTSDNSLRAEFRMSQICANAPLENAFDLSGYTPKFVRSLDELEKRSQ